MYKGNNILTITYGPSSKIPLIPFTSQAGNYEALSYHIAINSLGDY